MTERSLGSCFFLSLRSAWNGIFPWNNGTKPQPNSSSHILNSPLVGLKHRQVNYGASSVESKEKVLWVLWLSARHGVRKQHHCCRRGDKASWTNSPLNLPTLFCLFMSTSWSFCSNSHIPAKVQGSLPLSISGSKEKVVNLPTWLGAGGSLQSRFLQRSMTSRFTAQTGSNNQPCNLAND